MPNPTFVPVIATGRDVEFASVTLTGEANLTTVFATYVEGQTSPRSTLNAGGGYAFGGGSGAPDTNLYRNGPNVLRTDSRLEAGGNLSTEGDVVCNVAGGGLVVREGANATSGAATLVAGTVTVATTQVTATSRIHLTPQTLGTVATPKAVGITARTPGTSFTITSADATDTSLIAWTIVEPAV